MRVSLTGLLSSTRTAIAVKQLSLNCKQGNCKFINEIGIISGLQHPNLIKLYGCCVEGDQLMLVYEYMENNSVSRALFGRDAPLKLDWPTRWKICLRIARGLAYIHEEARLKIVHKDIETSNVFLDKDLNAKISDFGLAKLYEDDNAHINTRATRTLGYMAPEYAMWGHLTKKSDVYSFGTVTLELVSGRSVHSNHSLFLRDWALDLKKKVIFLEHVDPRLGSDYDKVEVRMVINVALLCDNASPAVRPFMSLVVGMLNGRTAPVVPDPGASSEQMNLMTDFLKSLETDTSDGQIGSISFAFAQAGSDLYLLNGDSDILEDRD